MRNFFSCPVRWFFIGDLSLLLAFLPAARLDRSVQGAVQVAGDSLKQESNNGASSEAAEQSEPTQSAQASSPVSPPSSSKNIKLSNTLNGQSSPDSVISTVLEPISSQVESFDPLTPVLKPVLAPPKRLGLAISGTALIGTGLYALGVYLAVKGKFMTCVGVVDP